MAVWFCARAALFGCLVLCACPAHGAFNVSNVLGDGMVLQRSSGAPPTSTQPPTVVWGFGDTPGELVTTTFLGKALSPPSVVGVDGVWRQVLPPTPARTEPTTISFAGSGGDAAALRDVLFGDVLLCSGQSNMQYTPYSMAGMNDVADEVAAADAYGDTVRFFTVGMDTSCGDPAKNQTDCSQPFRQLNEDIPVVNASTPCRGGYSCREGWSRASAKALGGDIGAGPVGWNTFSAVCWLTGRDIHDALGGKVPIGLISSNWGGTHVQVWQPARSVMDCNGGKNATGGVLYNSMIAPYTVGPMALTGATWYQGERCVRARGCCALTRRDATHPYSSARSPPRLTPRPAPPRVLQQHTSWRRGVLPLRLPLDDQSLARGLPERAPLVRVRASGGLPLLHSLRQPATPRDRSLARGG